MDQIQLHCLDGGLGTRVRRLIGEQGLALVAVVEEVRHQSMERDGGHADVRGLFAERQRLAPEKLVAVRELAGIDQGTGQ